MSTLLSLDQSSAVLPSSADAAAQLEHLWRQGQRPHILDFLEVAGTLSPAQLAAVLLVDQREHWRLGDQLPAEDYLAAFPALQGTPAALDLVYGEFLLRERLGESPSLEDYQQRFPAHAAALRQQVSLHRMLASVARNGAAVATTFLKGAGTPDPGPAPRTFPNYEILGELGRGGMGVVYKARQVGLNRVVALKMILAGSHATAQDHARFRIEAEAIARLQHPNIVQVYEIGEHEGRPFFSLEYCSGGSLEKHLHSKPLAPRAAAELVATLAGAVHHAHEQGILHRDLKPANILLAQRSAASGGAVEEGRGRLCYDPKVADFGLAKQLDSGVALTAAGLAAGTPSYMAPEQVRANAAAIGPRTDVYALGAILYETLTGRPPFLAGEGWDVMLQVTEHEPVPPSRLQPSTPRDLQTICLKCLEKEPSRRYESAAALADDLRRFLNGEPITACPTGAATRAWRWCRRKPLVASLLAALTGALLLGTTTATFFALNAEAQATLAEQKAHAAENALRAEALAHQEARTARKAEAARAEREADARRKEEAARREADAARRQSDEDRETLKKALLRSEWLVYAGNLGLAQHEWQDGRTGHAQQLLASSRDTFRGWEYDYLQRRWFGSQQHLVMNGPCYRMALSPDGERLAVTTLLPGKGACQLKLWHVPSRKVLANLPGAVGNILSVAFSPDGKEVVAGGNDRAVRVWDGFTGKLKHTLHHHTSWIHHVDFSADGKTVLSASGIENVLLWQPATDVKRTVRFRMALRQFAGSPDGKRFAAASVLMEGPPPPKGELPPLTPVLRVYDAVKGGKAVHILKGHTKNISAIAWSPDGKVIASGAPDTTVRLWDAAAGRELRTLRGHTATIHGLAFSADGKQLASTGMDATVRVWNVASGEEVRTFRGHAKPISTVAWAGDGQTLVSGAGGSDSAVKIWSMACTPGPRVLPWRGTVIWALTFSPNGRFLAAGGGADLPSVPQLCVWNAAGEVVAGRARQPVKSLAFSADSKLLAAGQSDGTLFLLDTGTWGEVRKLIGHKHAVEALACSPDGKFLASSSYDRTIKLWKLADGEEAWELPGHRGYAQFLTWSADGKHLVVAASQRLHLWDVAARREVWAIDGGMGLACVVFHPDGKRLFAGGGNGQVKEWDAATGQLLRTLKGHAGVVRRLVFSRDGKRFFTAGADRTVKIWETEQGQDLLTLRDHTGAVFGLDMSPDGTRLATASADLTVRLWDAVK